jgi:hypothetical protein
MNPARRVTNVIIRQLQGPSALAIVRAGHRSWTAGRYGWETVERVAAHGFKRAQMSAAKLAPASGCGAHRPDAVPAPSTDVPPRAVRRSATRPVSTAGQQRAPAGRSVGGPVHWAERWRATAVIKATGGPSRRRPPAWSAAIKLAPAPVRDLPAAPASATATASVRARSGPAPSALAAPPNPGAAAAVAGTWSANASAPRARLL